MFLRDETNVNAVILLTKCLYRTIDSSHCVEAANLLLWKQWQCSVGLGVQPMQVG